MSGDRANSAEITESRPNPHSPWQCGYAPLGFGCADGPTKHGVCCQIEAVNQHKPIRQEGVTSDTGQGHAYTCVPGNCEHGCGIADACEVAKLRRAAALPSHTELGPCIPQRSNWFSRQNLTLNTAILVGGILLLCMAMPGRETIFVPGELSTKHSQIIGNQLASERCSLCHPNAHPARYLRVTQDELCLNCHASHLPDAALQSPHDLSPENLTLVSHESRLAASHDTAFDGTPINGAGIDLSPRLRQVTRCATCHIEHHGADGKINAISDARCQACHQTQFASLAKGHPQFDGYPYRSEIRIQFSHKTHLEKHFAAKHEVFDCTRCHVDQARAGNVGSVFRIVGFDAACASCHAEPIRSSAVNGWALLQLPAILPADAEDPQFGLMDWPQSARFDYDGEISPAARLLLEADEEDAVQEALSALPISGRLSEIDRSARPRLVRVVALAVRNLIAEVARDGQAAWHRRLLTVFEKRLQRKPSDYELGLIRRLSVGLPPDLFRQIELDWFEQPAGLAVLGPNRDPVLSPGFGPSTNRLQLTSGALPAAQQLESTYGVADPAQAGAEHKSQGQHLLNQELLGRDLLGEELDNEELDDDLLSSGPELLGESVEPGEKEQLVRLRGDTHVAEGGWYLDKRLLSLLYKPTGHADETLSAWAEFQTLIDGEADRSADWSHGQTQSLAASVPGDCMECHLLGQEVAPKREWSNWRSILRPETVSLFTKFNHTPHLTLPALADCNYCHALHAAPQELWPNLEERATEQVSSNLGFEAVAAQRSQPANSADRDSPAGAVSDLEFEPMLLTQCVTCHRPGGADDGCTQCHNYHVGQTGFGWSHASGRNVAEPK